MDRGTQTSNERECLSNRCKFLWPRGFITVTQVSGNRRHTQKAGLAVNTAATPCSYLNTNRQYLLCTKAAGAQKKTGFQGPNSCWIFSPRLASGQLQGKYLRKRVDKASKNKLLTWPSHHLRGSENVAKQNRRFKLYFHVTLLQTDFNFFLKKNQSNLFHYVK